MRPSKTASCCRSCVTDPRLRDESQRKDCSYDRCAPDRQRSFANDIAPRLSTRELTLTQDDACRPDEGTRGSAVTDPRLRDESQRKDCSYDRCAPDRQRSFANDISPRLSTRELTQTQDDACRPDEGSNLRRRSSPQGRRPSPQGRSPSPQGRRSSPQVLRAPRTFRDERKDQFGHTRVAERIKEEEHREGERTPRANECRNGEQQRKDERQW